MTTWDEINAAFWQAKATLNLVAGFANSSADILEGNLRKVSAHRLRKLKRELSQFDAKKGEWKS